MFRKVFASGTERQKEIVIYQGYGADLPGGGDLLLEAAKTSSGKLRKIAIRRLGVSGVTHALPWLRELMKESPGVEVVPEAIRKLMEYEAAAVGNEIMQRPDVLAFAEDQGVEALSDLGLGVARGWAVQALDRLSTHDLFSLWVALMHRWDGRLRFSDHYVFAAGLEFTRDPRMIEPLIKYLNEYPHEVSLSVFMSGECLRVFRQLDEIPGAAEKIVDFVADEHALNRELGLGFLGGRGQDRMPKELEAFPRLEALLGRLIADADPAVAAEAKRLDYLRTTAPDERDYASILFDLRVERDRYGALSRMMFDNHLHATPAQREETVMILLELLGGMAEKGYVAGPTGLIEVASNVGDPRLAAPLIRLMKNYDPDLTDGRSGSQMNKIRRMLQKMGYSVELQKDGVYRVMP